MVASILKYHPNAEFYFDEGCYITELSNSDNDNDVSIAKARVKPGVTTRWHRLNGVIERYIIISGVGVVEMGDIPATRVKANDVVLIPSLQRQRICNDGTQDLIFLAICSPRFTRECYQDLDVSE